MEVVAIVTSWFTPTTLFLLLNLMIGTIVITSRFGSGPKKIHHPPDPFGSVHAHHHHLHVAPLARAPSLIDRVKSINFHLYKFPSPETEFFTTQTGSTGSDPHPGPDPVPLARAPSLLDRVKSVNLSYFKFPQYNPESEYPTTTRPDDDNPVYPTRIDRVDSPDPIPASEIPDPVDQPRRLARAPSLLERVKSINFSSFYRSDPNQPDHDPNPNPNPVSHKEDHKPQRSKSETTKKKKKTAATMTRAASERHAPETETETDEAVERRRPETVRVERSTSFGDGEDGVDAKAADFINKFKQQLKLQRLDSILRYKEMLKSN